MAALAPQLACSAVTSVYVQRGYDVHSAAPIKRIAVAAWAPSDTQGVADVVSQVASDLIKLRKNYLVHATQPIKRSWAELCADKLDGVFVARVMESEPRGDKLFLDLTAELYRCSDGALVWRAEGQAAPSSADANLAKLTANYVKSAGTSASAFAAPAFVLLQQLIDSLPDPTLNDADVEEKIELSATVPRLERGTLRPHPGTSKI
jgi:probable lipoprotein (TIGR04455 family)